MKFVPMHRKATSLTRFIISIGLALASISILPRLAVTAQSSSTTTPVSTASAIPSAARARLASRLRAEYPQIRSELFGLRFIFDQVAGYRRAYVAFQTSEQFHGRDTKILDSSLTNFDSFVSLTTTARKNGIEALDGTTGFDSNGNVIDVFTVGDEIQKAVGFDSTARGNLVRAVFEIHSALNLYHQVWGATVPDIPKLRLAPFTFTKNP